jgi:4-hydroxy-tetrahydrodipicolinate synthase
MKFPATGIIPPMVTPLSGRDTLDIPGLERLVEHLLAGGVTGIFVLGTTGEGPSLGYGLRSELIERVCRLVGKRVPVLVGISDTAFVESLNISRHAAQHGADALVLAPPYYLPEGQPELLEYLGHLIPELPLPLYLYNMPSLTKVSYELDTVRRLLDEPRIRGLKDSSGNMTYFHRVLEIVQTRPDWSLLMGPEELLFDAVLAGGHGGVSGGANLFPELYLRLYEAARDGNLIRARELRRQLMRVSELIYGVGRHSSAIIKGIKCALSCMGLCDDFMAEPFHRFRKDEREKVQRNLEILKAEILSLKL